MTQHNDNDDFTRNLNDRIRELEDMTNEINDQTNEIEDQASKDEESTTTSSEITQAPREEGDSIFFTANLTDGQPLKLNITNNNGDVDIIGTEMNHVEIVATRQSGEDVDHGHWFFQQVDNEITLRPNWQVGSHVSDLASKLKSQLKEGFKTSDWSSKDFKFGMDVNYDLSVKVPMSLAEDSAISVKIANGDGTLKHINAKVDYKTANGDLSVENVEGQLTLNSANGDLTAKGISGNTTASTANGDISLEGITGSVEANTANGDVHINASTGWVAVRTASGDVRVENATIMGGRFATVAGDISVNANLVNATNYSFDSVGGDVIIDVRVPAEGATFTGRTVGGDIDTSGEWTKGGKREWTLGAGNGPMLSAKTVNSDIRVTAVMDSSLTLLNEDPAGVAAEKEGTSSEKRDGEVNINIDLELERAKGWLKDVGSKLGTMLVVDDKTKPEAPKKPEMPEEPVAPAKPDAPVSPAQAEADAAKATATAERRQHLLEAVKNGEMTVDEALAELERDA